MRHSIKINIWKDKENVYGEPDETTTVGEYFSTEAAEADISTLSLRLACAGYAKFDFEIIDKEVK